ncbi:hypothetical protein CRE_02411 [Caenorhabditis remanei]|uniref:Uncharacterized protein n=1 Tax=Caenorhabditis remanei TaxID=31234 RepID=E3MIN3_CAERE|nr:hypothetical protein CRE_02411 [Caenorhabditis remanei]
MSPISIFKTSGRVLFCNSSIQMGNVEEFGVDEEEAAELGEIGDEEEQGNGENLENESSEEDAMEDD